MGARFDRWIAERKRLSQQYDTVNEAKYKLDMWRDTNNPRYANEVNDLLKRSMTQ